MKKHGLTAVCLVAMALLFSGCNTKKVPTIVVEDPKTTTHQQNNPDDVIVQPGPVIIPIDDNLSQVDVTPGSSMETVYFDFDSFELDDESYDRVVGNSETFKKMPGTATIRVEGHCDAWGSDEYNMALGLDRAKAVKKAMVQQGVEAERISMMTYGKMNPVCHDKTSECFAKNRRVEFKVFATEDDAPNS